MSARREELRKAVGRALRRVRQGWRLSLDDVEQASGAMGVRITRSHLSRVENGQADLALPRFLCLLRAVGEPAAEVVESLDALLDPDGGDLHETQLRAFELAGRGEPAAAARLFRQAARRADEQLPQAALEMWAAVEVAVGRWQAAARVLRGAMSPLGQAAPHLLLRLAAVTLGANQPGVAGPIARAALDRAPRAALLVECTSLLETAPAAAVECLAQLDGLPGESSVEERAVSLIVKSEHHRRRGQVRTAMRFAEQAAASTGRSVVGVEALLALARAAGDARRSAQGRAALERGLALARNCALPDLLALCHREGERLFKLDGDHDAARHALRSARAIWRRHASDRSAPRSLPLHALFDLCRG